MSCASGRDSRASIRSVQTNGGQGTGRDSSMSMCSVTSRAESRADRDYPRADHTRADSRSASRSMGSDGHRYIYDYDQDYG